MADKETVEEVARALRAKAHELIWTADALKTYADRIDPPDFPQVSQASHHSG